MGWFPGSTYHVWRQISVPEWQAKEFLDRNGEWTKFHSLRKTYETEQEAMTIAHKLYADPDKSTAYGWGESSGCY